MTRIVKEWRGTASSVWQALELADARGQLVSVEPLRANERGVAVRVVLRGVELPSPAPAAGQRRTAAPRRDPDGIPTRRQILVGVSVGAGIPLGVGTVWAVRQACVWVGHNWTLLLGGAVVLLVVAACLTAAVMGGGGDKHPCNR